MKRNETKRNETELNETKRNRTKRNEHVSFLTAVFSNINKPSLWFTGDIPEMKHSVYACMHSVHNVQIIMLYSCTYLFQLLSFSEKTYIRYA